MDAFIQKSPRIRSLGAWLYLVVRFLVGAVIISFVLSILITLVYPTDVVPGEQPERIRWLGMVFDEDDLIGFGILFSSAVLSLTHLVVSSRTAPVPTKPVESTG